MDIQNIVTDQDTELLDSEITEISQEFAETYYFDNGKIEELEALVAKAMKLGELYERKKWQEGGAAPKIKGYYSHDGDNYQMHETLCQAKADALGAIEHYSDQLADGHFHPESNGNFQDISYGIVLGKSSYSLVSITTQQDIDNGECKYPAGTEILELHLDEVAEIFGAMVEAAENKENL